GRAWISASGSGLQVGNGGGGPGFKDAPPDVPVVERGQALGDPSGGLGVALSRPTPGRPAAGIGWLKKSWAARGACRRGEVYAQFVHFVRVVCDTAVAE